MTDNLGVGRQDQCFTKYMMCREKGNSWKIYLNQSRKHTLLFQRQVNCKKKLKEVSKNGINEKE